MTRSSASRWRPAPRSRCSPASRRSGTRRSPSLALLYSGLYREHPVPGPRIAPGSLRNRYSARATGASSGRTSSPGDGRSSSRTAGTPTWTTRRSCSCCSGKYADKDSGREAGEPAAKACGGSSGMQGSDGGWGAFDVDNDMRVLNQLLFGDLEAMIDPSTPDLTGRVLELLGAFGFGPANENVRRAIAFIKANPGTGRLVVGQVGREPSVRNLHGAVRAWRRSARTCRSPTYAKARALDQVPPERRRRLGRKLRVLSPDARRTPAARTARRRRPPGRSWP